MSIVELITKLAEVQLECGADVEVAHGRADRLLLDYIGDQRVSDAYDRIEKWYA